MSKPDEQQSNTETNPFAQFDPRPVEANPFAQFDPPPGTESYTLKPPVSSLGDDPGALTRMGRGVEIGLRNMGISSIGREIASLGERIQYLNDYEKNMNRIDPGYGELDPEVKQRFDAEKIEKLAEIEVLLKEAADKQQAIAQIPQDPDTLRFHQADGWKDSWDAFTKDPAGIAADITFQSAIPSLIPLAATAASRGAGAGRWLSALAGGTTTMFNEFGSDYLELRQQGVEHDQAFQQAAIKSGVIGLFDAASMGFADIAAVKMMGSKALGKVYAGAKETARGAALGGGGEAAGSVLSNREIDPGSVMSEMIGEGAMVGPNILGARLSQPKQPEVAGFLPAPETLHVNSDGKVVPSNTVYNENLERENLKRAEHQRDVAYNRENPGGHGMYEAYAYGSGVEPQAQHEPVAAPALPAPSQTLFFNQDGENVPASTVHRERLEHDNQERARHQEELAYNRENPGGHGMYEAFPYQNGALQRIPYLQDQDGFNEGALEFDPELTEPEQMVSVLAYEAGKAGAPWENIETIIDRAATDDEAIAALQTLIANGGKNGQPKAFEINSASAYQAANNAMAEQAANKTAVEQQPKPSAPQTEVTGDQLRDNLTVIANSVKSMLDPASKKAAIRPKALKALNAALEADQPGTLGFLAKIDEATQSSGGLSRAWGKRSNLWKRYQAAVESEKETATQKKVDEAASEAATSPENSTPEPTEAQKKAGNYKKGHVSIGGLDVSIENPKGSTRSGIGPDGNKWSVEMQNHYGYVKRTEGADGDHVDVFIGDNADSDKVFIVDQVNADGSFDEHKVMLGFDSKEAAVAGYKSNYEKGWKVGPVSELSLSGFSQWLKEGDTKKPFSGDVRKRDKKDGAPKGSDKGGHSNGVNLSDYDLDTPITHQGYDIDKIEKTGVFDGLFGSYGESSRGGINWGTVETTFYARKGKIAGSGDSFVEDYNDAIEWLKKELDPVDPLTDEELERLYSAVMEDENLIEFDVNPFEELGFRDRGEASWEAQRLRGQYAAHLGYDAVEMSDEHGVSVLIPYGSKAIKESDLRNIEKPDIDNKGVADNNKLTEKSAKKTTLDQEKPKDKSGKAVQESESEYSSNERNTSNVQSGEQEDSANEKAVDDLYTAKTVPARTAREQAKDNFNIHYTQKEVGSLPTGLERVNSAADAAHVFAPIRKHAQETFMVLVTDKDNKPVNLIRHSKGSKDQSIVNVAEVAGAVAATDGAKNVWFGHNHPSGNLTPSDADSYVTGTLVSALDGLGVNYRGHIIVGDRFDASFFKSGRPDAALVRIKPSARRKNIPVTERVLRKRNLFDAPSIQDPYTAESVVKGIQSKDAILLLDTQYTPIGTVSISAKEMQALRGGDRVRRLLKAINDTNADAVIIKTGDKEAAANIARFVNNLQEIRVLDWFDSDFNSDARNNSEVIGSTGPFFSRAKTPEAKSTANQVKEWVKPVTKGWGDNAPAIKVFDSVDQIPESIKKKADSDLKDQTIKGFYFDGTVGLIAGNIDSKADALKTLAHEARGHWGLSQLKNEDYQRLIRQVQRLKKSDSDIKAIAKQVESGYGKLDEAQETEEIIAVLAEQMTSGSHFKNKVNDLMLRVVGQVRKLLRRLFGISFGKGDILAMLANNQRKLASNKKNHRNDQSSPMFSAKAPIDQGGDVAKKTLNEVLEQRDRSNIQAVKEWLLKKAPDDFIKENGLKMLTLRQLGDISKKLLPQIDQYVDVIHEMMADRNTMAEKAVKVIQRWQAWAAKNRVMAGELNEAMSEATLAGVDPSEEYTDLTDFFKERIAVLEQRSRDLSGSARHTSRFMKEKKELEQQIKQEPQRKRDYDRLQQRWAKLSPEAKELFVEVRDEYKKQHNRMKNIMLNRIKNAEINNELKKELLAKLRFDFESKELTGPYFPLSRFGRYWISTVDENGEKVFSLLETKIEQKNALKALKENGYPAQGGMLLDNDMGQDGASLSFVNDVIERISEAEINDEKANRLVDEVYQLYLESMPARSMRKNFIHRKGIKGYSNNAIRGFASHMMKSAYQLARLNRQDDLALLLKEMRNEALKGSEEGANGKQHLYNEMKKRHEWVMNPTNSNWAQQMTKWGFIYMLGLTPAAALVNITQTPVVAWPVLGARFGFAKTATHFANISGKFNWKTGRINEKYLSQDEKLAMDQWIALGVLDTTGSHALMGLAENGGFDYSDREEKAMKVISWGFHRAEQFNREITALSAYRMAREKGIEHNKAVKLAADLTWDAHFDYTNVNRAAFMQDDWQKVAFQFKQYSQSMTYYMLRNVQQAVTLKDIPAEERKIAFKQAVGTLGITGILAGANGLPLSGLFFMANVLFNNDEDEPFDARAEFQRFLVEKFGKDMADSLMYGALGASVSGRISLDGLWLRESNRDLEGEDAWAFYTKQFLGPVVGGIFPSFFEGMRKISHGEYYRGVENFLPKAGRDVLKAFRYMDEGAQTLKGDNLKAQEDFTLPDLMLQAIGFADAEVSKQYNENAIIKGYEKKILDRSRVLMAQYYLAWKDGNQSDINKVIAAIQRFNRKNPRKRITVKSLKQSVKSRERYRRDTINGINVSKRLRYLADQYDVAN